ncbi:MAG: hypothetical protein RJB03_1756, partial [Bacteroidota bacterium]
MTLVLMASAAFSQVTSSSITGTVKG